MKGYSPITAKKVAMLRKQQKCDGVVTLDELLDFCKLMDFATRHERDVLNGLVKMFNMIETIV